MSVVTYRYDYAKFLFTCSAVQWNFISQRMHTISHTRQYHGDWLRHHKTTRLWFNPDNEMETWSVEIWGEWAQIVHQFPGEWLLFAKRLDVRGLLWDATEATIIETGQALQRIVRTLNVNVYSTKPRSKQGGRDAGGVGFAVGSHKSDLRVTCYKRKGEPCAQEYQCSGAMLHTIATEQHRAHSQRQGTTDPWHSVKLDIEERGTKRLADAFRRGGLGDTWPTFARNGSYDDAMAPVEHYEPTAADLEEMQATFGDDLVLPGDQQ